MNDRSDSRADSFLLRLTRFYTFNFPIDKGKGRVFNFTKRFVRKFPDRVTVKTKDGRYFRVGFRDWADDYIYFLGRYEAFSTEMVRRHVRDGSICFDVGANAGWYTTLFQSLCGGQGEVHAFEPVPSAFDELRQNVFLNNNSTRVFLNNTALGDEIRNADMHLFPRLPSGHASLSDHGSIDSTSVPIKIVTLDSYMAENRIDQVDFVKVDIEGAELMFLKGAGRLFAQKRLPVILMEMSPETCAAFNYKPDDLIEFISSRAHYDFFVLDERKKRLSRIRHFDGKRGGANVLCIPSHVKT